MMTKLILKRLWQSIFVLLFVSIVVFGAMHLSPGDPATLKLGQAAADPRNVELLEQVRESMGLDRSVPYQYFAWLRDVVRGDFGVSYRSGQPVLTLILEKIPATFQLVFSGLIIGIMIAIPLGTLQAHKYNTKFDRITYFISLFLISIPGFWLGLSLIILFSVSLGWLPPGGYVSFISDPLQNLQRLIMPAITIGIFEAVIFLRFIRSEMSLVLTEDYIKMAYAKGLSDFSVVAGHGLRNSLIAFLTVVGMEIGALVGNVIIIEQVFRWPGLGWLVFNAIQNRDYAIVQGVVLLICIIFILANLLTDIAYIFLNPQFKEHLRK